MEFGRKIRKKKKRKNVVGKKKTTFGITTMKTVH